MVVQLPELPASEQASMALIEIVEKSEQYLVLHTHIYRQTILLKKEFEWRSPYPNFLRQKSRVNTEVVKKKIC